MRAAIPTNDHRTTAGTLAGAKGVMVYLIEDGQVSIHKTNHEKPKDIIAEFIHLP